MDFNKHSAQGLLEDWFRKATDWQKDLFSAIWNGAMSEEQIVDRTIKLIGQEHLFEDHRLSPNIAFPNDINFTDSKRVPIMLTSISDVKGVGALAPQSALIFGSGLTVVYGENGCGKSSYVRILKALENPANADAVIGNVFEPGFVTPAALITFSLDGDSKNVKWSKASKKKYPLQIYDTSIAKQFVDKENEVVYEPKVLSTVTKMAMVYEKISAYYDVLVGKTSQKVTQIPQDLQDHPIVREYATLSSMRDVDIFAKKYLWSTDLDTELNATITSLKENDPQQVASKKIAQKDIIRNHEMNILKLGQLLTDLQCAGFLEKRKMQISTKATADALISASQNQSLLGNFGTDIWKLMWEYANEYIKSIEGNTGIPTTL
ncbi:MAG: ATP-binding protein, partial [Lachnospiraceae bacterium]